MFHPLADSPTGPKTIYTDSAPEGIRFESLTSELKTDVAVIGAGFMGLAAALQASKRGMNVVVLEAQEVGWGSSGRNQGQIVPALRQEPDALLAAYGKERGQRFYDAVGAGPDVVFKLIEKYQLRCDAKRNGIITAAHSRQAFDKLRSRAAYWIDRGQSIDILSGTDAARAIGSPAYVGGVLDHRGGTVNPLALVRELSRVTAGLGARIFTKSKVTGISRGVDQWRVSCPTGAVTASKVLICTNAYTEDLWPGLARAVVPIRAHQLITAPIGEDMRREILPGGHAMSDTRRMMIGVRMHPDGRLQTGGASAVTGPEREPAYDRITKRIRSVFPQLGEFEWESSWSGWMAMTPDYLPRLHHLAPGVMAGLGCNGRGVALSTIIGRQMARFAAGASPTELIVPVTPLSPLRFHSLHPMGVAALVTYGRFRDALDGVRDLFAGSVRGRRTALAPR